ncbi:MAG: right-handed parallel beta-helix repeat-containing protein [Bryobacteraceae bacterium]|nr:right-handed parallel beta-helix repeat-containing protein [Bryobacteraceae bacterium]
MKNFLAIMALVLICGCSRESELHNELAGKKSGEVTLPKGDFSISQPILIEGADGLTVRGAGTRIRMNFDGPAAIVIRTSKGVRLEDFTLLGNRAAGEKKFGLPPADAPMAKWNSNNGILVEDSSDLLLSKLTIREVSGYAILISKSNDATVRDVFVGDSGSLNEMGKNNATGGILFEEGCQRFAAEQCKLRNIRGNGIWTHSLYTSPRNRDGRFEGNEIRYAGRDALQAGHATGMKIAGNSGGFIGFPPEIVDLATGAVPVAIDTAGNVENSEYSANRFEEVNGKCMDLDGFHDGAVRQNQCTNSRAADAYPHGHYGIVLNNSNPDMESKGIQIVSNVMEGFRFGGLFLIGGPHVVRDNVFRNLNLAHCNENPAAGCLYKPDEPDLLRTGVYLGNGAHRPSPAKGNVVENNEVQGYQMTTRCVGYAPGVDKAANTVRNNRCSG